MANDSSNNGIPQRDYIDNEIRCVKELLQTEVRHLKELLEQRSIAQTILVDKQELGSTLRLSTIDTKLDGLSNRLTSQENKQHEWTGKMAVVTGLVSAGVALVVGLVMKYANR